MVYIHIPNGAKSKMINNTHYQEGDISPRKLSNPNYPITSRQYSIFKNNPRIVRASQASGGKDRHSKVWTVKGLRDRRIRLSIPTAIQLYDLQDQLGLSQPSKVIDWLLDVTKDDIDNLPPLQMSLEDLNRFHLPSPFVPQDFNTTTQLSFSPFFNMPAYDHQKTKGKEVIVENKPNICNYHDHFRPPSDLSLSRFGHQLDTNYVPSSSALPSEPPYFSCFSGIAPPSLSHPYLMPNHFQLLSSSSSHVLPNSLVPVPLNLMDSTQLKLPFGLNMNSKVDSESAHNDTG